MVDKRLEKLYDERDNLEYRIEMEKTKRNQQGINGMSPDFFELSIEREALLEEKLASIQTEIKRLETPEDKVVQFGGRKQNDFIKGIDDDKIIKDVLGEMGLNTNNNAKVEIQKDTTIKVTEDLGDNREDVQIFTKTDLESIQTNNGKKVGHDKSSSINFILKEMKDGKTINEAVKSINVSLNDVNLWLESGKQGKDQENTIFYNEVKQLESSSDIVIDAKKVEDTKKGFDRKNPKVKVKYGRNNINYR